MMALGSWLSFLFIMFGALFADAMFFLKNRSVFIQ